MKKSLWMLGKKIFFTLVFISFGLTSSIFAEQEVKFGDSVRIKNVRRDYYLAVIGNEIFARKEPSTVTIFKIVADIQNVAARTGQDVKFGEDIYLMSDGKFVGKFGGEFLIYAGRRRLLGIGSDKLNLSLFKILPSFEKGRAVPNFVSYGDIIQFQASGNEYIRMNVDITTHPKGLECFFAIDEWGMTPLAKKLTKEFVLEFVSRRALPPTEFEPISMAGSTELATTRK